MILTLTPWGEKIGRLTTYTTDPKLDNNNNSLIHTVRPSPYMRGNLAPNFPSQEKEVVSFPYFIDKELQSKDY